MQSHLTHNTLFDMIKLTNNCALVYLMKNVLLKGKVRQVDK